MYKCGERQDAESRPATISAHRGGATTPKYPSRKQSCAAVDRGNWCRFPHRRAGPFLCADKEMDERKPLRSRGRYATSLAPCYATGSGREAVPRLTAGTRTSCPRPFGPALLATAHWHAPTGSKNLPKPCGLIERYTPHKPIFYTALSGSANQTSWLSSSHTQAHSTLAIK